MGTAEIPAAAPNQALRATIRDAGRGESAAYLLIFQADSSRKIELPFDGQVTIGRLESAHVRISDDSVSRAHAKLVLCQGVAMVEDTGSQNGTWVNGERITGPRQLVAGDVLQIGDASLAYQSAARRHAKRDYCALPQLQQKICTEITRAVRYGRTISVVVVNIGLGVAVDRARVGKLLAPRIREIDTVAWGSEDQLIILAPETDVVGAATFANALLSLLRVEAPQVAAGVAGFPADGVDADTLISSARIAATRAAAGSVALTERQPQSRQIGDFRVVVGDPVMAQVFDAVERLAKSNLTVLVSGETGTGKEIIATALHAWSPRAASRIVTVNCAAMTEALVERELFGHERGAFSGANTAAPGLLEAADGGTLFLDELGELSLAVQAKLLRALESKTITRVGGVREVAVNFRLVAATNRDLEAEIAAGRFRRDLYFRVSAATLWLPPLRDRGRELVALATSLLADACQAAGRPILELAPSAIHLLASYSWPGNVRELRNVMHCLASTVVGTLATSEDVWPRLANQGTSQIASQLANLSDAAPVPRGSVDIRLADQAKQAADATIKFAPLDEELRNLERQRIAEALDAFDGNQTKAAEAIAMPLRTFVLKVKQHGLRGKQK